MAPEELRQLAQKHRDIATIMEASADMAAEPPENDTLEEETLTAIGDDAEVVSTGTDEVLSTETSSTADEPLVEEEPEPEPVIEIVQPPLTPAEALELPFFVNPPSAVQVDTFNGHPGSFLNTPGKYELSSNVGGIQVVTNDVEIDLNGRILDRILLRANVERVHIYNGTVNNVECDWQTGTKDLNIHDVRSESTDIAYRLRGQRISLRKATVHSVNFCVWAGDIKDMEDFMFDECVMHSDGPQATLRVHDAYRSIVKNCSLSNNGKHSMRYHCSQRDVENGERRAHNLALIDSVLHGLGNGLMWGNTSSEKGIEDVFIYRNQFRAQGPDKFNLRRDMVQRADVRGNHLVTWGEWDPFQGYGEAVPEGWTWEDNTSSSS